jgi:hypothetical protein
LLHRSLAFDLLFNEWLSLSQFGGIIGMSEENGTGNNLIWAVTLIIVVALIAGALYYSGFLGGTKKQQIDVEVSTPAR